jgi:hypothetical protein
MTTIPMDKVMRQVVEGGPLKPASHEELNLALVKAKPDADAPVDPKRLRADGFESHGFQFPEPDSAMIMAIGVLTPLVGELKSESVQSNLFVSIVAWLIWIGQKPDGADRLFDFATLDGELPRAEFHQALREVVPMKRYADFTEAAGDYMAWLNEHFTPAPGEETGVKDESRSA